MKDREATLWLICVLLTLGFSLCFQLRPKVHSNEQIHLLVNRKDHVHPTNRLTQYSKRLGSNLVMGSSTQMEPIVTSKVSSALGAWIPVHSVSSLKDVQPTRVTIMNIDFVVWFNNVQNEWCVASDVCPHRLAPLSQGRVDEKSGCIECPYHGWRFDGDGTCTSIPAWSGTQDDFEKAAKKPDSPLHATGHPVHVVGDLIFVWLPTSVHGESFPKDVLPEDMYMGLREQAGAGAQYFIRELPYSFDMLVENFMDPAHIPFAHHGLQAAREDGTNIPMQVLVNNFTTIETSYTDVNRNKTFDRIVSFQRPNYYHFRTKNKETGEYQKALQIYCIPVRAGHSRVLFQSATASILRYKWLSHAASNRFLNTDTWLHDAERNLRIPPPLTGQTETDDRAYVMASTSDLGVKAFRTWWKQHGFANAPPHTFGAATKEQLLQLYPQPLSRRQQIDPWTNHVQTCSDCRAALRNWKSIQKWSLGATIISAALVGPSSPIVAAAFGITSFSLHYFSKAVATTMEGNPSPAGIDDRSVATK